MKKKKKNKEGEALSLKSCTECGVAISDDSQEKIWSKRAGSAFLFCSLDCYVVWAMRSRNRSC